MKWQLHVLKDNQPCCKPIDVEGTVDLGRQDSTLAKEQTLAFPDQQPVCYSLTGMMRVVVAPGTEHRMLRHIQVEPLPQAGMFRLRNLSKHVAINLSGGLTVAPSSCIEGYSPLEFRIDRWTLRAQVGEERLSSVEM